MLMNDEDNSQEYPGNKHFTGTISISHMYVAFVHVFLFVFPQNGVDVVYESVGGSVFETCLNK